MRWHQAKDLGATPPAFLLDLPAGGAQVLQVAPQLRGGLATFVLQLGEPARLGEQPQQARGPANGAELIAHDGQDTRSTHPMSGFMLRS